MGFNYTKKICGDGGEKENLFRKGRTLPERGAFIDFKRLN